MNNDDLDRMMRFHRFLLGQTDRRLENFRQAIARRVRAGDTVLDLGTGTGILAFFACAAGARRVYAVEAGPVIEIAKLLARANGFEDRIVFIARQSPAAELPEQVDVLVADISAPAGLQAGGLRFVIDARDRFLTSDGTLVPNAIDLFIAPVEEAEAYRDNIDAWDRQKHGIDLTAARSLAVNNLYPTRVEREALLAEPTCWAHVDLSDLKTAALKGEVFVTARKGGVLHGLCAWFTATLADEISIGNRPGESTTNFAQCFFPVARPVPLAEGDRIQIRIGSYDGADWRWRVDVDRPGAAAPVASFDHSTFWGLPISGSSTLRSLFGVATEEPFGRSENHAPHVPPRKQDV